MKSPNFSALSSLFNLGMNLGQKTLAACKNLKQFKQTFIQTSLVVLLVIGSSSATANPEITEKVASQELVQPIQPAKPAIIINKVVDYQQDKKLLIDSESQFNLPEHVIDAINHEVALSFKIQIELSEDSELFGIHYKRLRNTIEFHTELQAYGVNRLYALYNTRNHKAQTFKNIDDALQTLATLQGFPIASLSELHPEQRYTLRMRISLDYWKLPAPLLINAVFTDDWRLDSQWFETTLTTPLSWQ